MKKIFLIVLAAACLLACKDGKKGLKANDAVQVDNKEFINNVDLVSSVLHWKGTKPTGNHVGTVKLKEGNLDVKDGAIVSGKFVIDMETLSDSENNAKLENHLKSADFFEVKKYPTSEFVITSVAKKEDKLAVTGNLTIKGITKSVTIPANISETDGVVAFTSDVFNINRAHFNVKYGSKSFFDNLKNKFIDDMMEMSFVVKTVK